jgi:hypothetical protein
MTTTQTTTQTTCAEPHIMSGDSARATEMRAKICTNLNRALGYQPRGTGPPDEGGDDGDHRLPGGAGDPPAEGPPDGPPAPPGGADAGAHGPEVKPMGVLPQLFYGDQTRAKDFIEEVKNFLCLNWDVPGYNCPIRKVAFTLSLLNVTKFGKGIIIKGRCTCLYANYKRVYK